MKSSVCTLFEGHYHLGAGALVNSLHRSGFTGRIICGYRGAEPSWADAARRLTNTFEITFVPLSTGVHFTYYKPAFLQACMETHASDCGQFYYFDPDIVIKEAPWSVFERWAQDGIALCEDANGYLPPGHPYRLLWTDFLRRHGFDSIRPMERYYNAGFIGLPRTHADFLKRWNEIVKAAERELGALDKIKNSRPHALFHTSDQDAMNMALMSLDAPINAAGPEGMDFVPGGHLLSHAVGTRKPWKGSYVSWALRGTPPGPAHKAFFKFADSPLEIFPPGELARLRRSLVAASVLGRVYRRA